jgi:hypothetical protein
MRTPRPGHPPRTSFDYVEDGHTETFKVHVCFEIEGLTTCYAQQFHCSRERNETYTAIVPLVGTPLSTVRRAPFIQLIKG